MAGQAMETGGSNQMENSFGPETLNSHGPELAYYQHMPNAPPEVVTDHQSPSGFYAPEYGKNDSEQTVDEKAVGDNANKAKKRVLGLPVMVFWAIVAAVLLAFGLGLGLGLGLRSSASSSDSDTSPDSDAAGSLTSTGNQSTGTTSAAAEENSASPTTEGDGASTTTSSSTSSAPVTSGTVGLADNSCTSSSPSTYYSSEGNQAFTKYCATDWPRGIAAFDGDGTVDDLSSSIVYTFEACMDLCLNYNSLRSDGETLCNAVTYNSNLTRSIEGQNANCFLKDKRGVDFSATAETASGVRVP